VELAQPDLVLQQAAEELAAAQQQQQQEGHYRAVLGAEGGTAVMSEAQLWTGQLEQPLAGSQAALAGAAAAAHGGPRAMGGAMCTHSMSQIRASRLVHMP
jgi:hypothetical protein